MSEKHYLLKVLGISAVPKLFTFAFTLISFPLLMRALGAETYGVFLFISSSLGLFEVLVDFGVSSAAGKSMAAVRVYNPSAIRREFFAWARLQALVVCIGFVPMLLAAYLMVKNSPSFQDTTLLLVMSAAVAFNVILNFIRPNLQSLLAFKSLAILDVFESIVRNSGFLIVAFLFSSALGLAIATLATSIITSAIAVVIIILRLSAARFPCSLPMQKSTKHWPEGDVTLKSRLRESANFLWLRLSTRLFQEGPIIILGRMLGAEVVGVVGVAGKVIELIGLPYAVMGNALKVRIQEVSRVGISALRYLWNAALRIVSTSIPVFFVLIIGSDLLASILLPANQAAPGQLKVVLLLFMPYIVTCLVPPMSDYYGGLLLRNILLSVTAIIQIPILWFASAILKTEATLFILVFCYSLMALGYTIIAAKVITGRWKPFIKNEYIIFSFMNVVAFVIERMINALPSVQDMFQGKSLIAATLFSIMIFIAIGISLVSLNINIRRTYLNRQILEFELTAQRKVNE